MNLTKVNSLKTGHHNFLPDLYLTLMIILSDLIAQAIAFVAETRYLNG
jgi:hypothetical protein